MFFQFALKYFFKLLHLGPYHELAITLFSIIVIIILVVFFRGIEFFEWFQGSNDGIIECAAFVQLCLILCCLCSLFFIMIEHHAPVLRAYVSTLAVQCSGIMCLPKNL